jgi:hypothetical protein
MQGGQTLTAEAGVAKMVLYGDLTKSDESPTTGEGTSELMIDTVIKAPKEYDVKKTIQLARFHPLNSNYRYLVYCDLIPEKGGIKVDSYRIVLTDTNSAMAKYLKGALEMKDKKIGERLRFFFDYLDNKDLEISNDAYREFANADYKDYCDMAKSLPADRVAKWLTDKDTQAFRIGLYASMLGHCGTKAHAKVLRDLLDDPIRRVGMGVDGILAGYVMLDAKTGWAYLREVLSDPSKEFLLRYAALRAGRFLHDYRTDLLPAKEITAGIALLLDQKDIADMAVDDFRKWKCENMTDRILALKGKPPYEEPIVRRAILRFCLSADTANAAAQAYVADLRRTDPKLVEDAEELLKLEQTPPPATTGK